MHLAMPHALKHDIIYLPKALLSQGGENTSLPCMEHHRANAQAGKSAQALEASIDGSACSRVSLAGRYICDWLEVQLVGAEPQPSPQI